MYERAVLMCGGSGTRLRPLTKCVNKHFLPIFDKPMIYYSLANLFHIGVRKVTIICNPKDISHYQQLFEHMTALGADFNYIGQEKPGGIAEGLMLFQKKYGAKDIVLALGDNLFFGNSILEDLNPLINGQNSGIVIHHVARPELYGVAEIDNEKNLLGLVEKPKSYISNLAVTGLYFYKEKAFENLKDLVPSQRGEYEITDFNNILLYKEELSYAHLGRGVTWYDAGDTKSLHDAAAIVKGQQERIGLLVGSPEEILLRTASKSDIFNFQKNFSTPKSDYEKLLLELLETYHEF
jgi:glucose-1-phosphate thymidylyltransferase